MWMQNQLSPEEGMTSRSLNLLRVGGQGNETSMRQSELHGFRIIRDHILSTHVM